MSGERKALRADLRAAIDGIKSLYGPLATAPVISAWAQSLDPKALPVIGVATPSEECSAATQDTTALDLTAVVVIKRVERTGDDGTALEDALDDDAEALIGPIEAAMQSARRDFELRSSAIDISAGSPRVGTLTLTFAASDHRARTIP
ncbi:hypothetical protein [Roseicitreum antarcticum]|uniref:hypothetical protein n=1 Tax=Roseicitreum antarcticum TaxID=564137 RepID=UPI0016816CC0|nr:hypothetical protein [Roseicitreum antarcticum]